MSKGSSARTVARHVGLLLRVVAAVSVDVNDHDFGAYEAYPDGSAAYPGSGSGSTIRIARVMPCSG